MEKSRADKTAIVAAVDTLEATTLHLIATLAHERELREKAEKERDEAHANVNALWLALGRKEGELMAARQEAYDAATKVCELEYALASSEEARQKAEGELTLDSLKEAAGWWVEWNAERYGVVGEFEPARIFVPGPIEHARWVAARLSDGWPGQDYVFYVVGDPESDEEDRR